MEPFTICLIMAWFIVTKGPEDLTHAIKGTTPPRFKAKAAAAAQAGKPYTPPRYGTREWFADLWTDSLEANTRWRRRRAANRAQARAAALDPSSEPASPGSGGGQDPSKTAPAPDPQTSSPEEPEIDLALDEEPPAPQPVVGGDESPLAPVIQLFKFNPKEFPMSVDAAPVTEEIAGLMGAIAHTRLCIATCENLGTPGGEDFLEHIRDTHIDPKDPGNGGQATVDATASLQESFDNTRLEAEKLLAYLEAQLAVKEASNAVGGEHGTKAFMNQGE